MTLTHIQTISNEFDLQPDKVQAVMNLLLEGATVPFIARYRKEVTGSLDEVAVTAIRDRLKQLQELDDRKSVILKSLEQNGHLTDILKDKVEAAETMAALEDIYLPYKPKRRTKGMIAREKGLEPLAVEIFEQKGLDPQATAASFIDPGKGVGTPEEALQGAQHIIAEWINEDENARSQLRNLFLNESIIVSRVVKGQEAAGAKYKDYFDWSEPLNNCPSHRLLAMRRGEKEDFLNLSITPPPESALSILEALFIKGTGPDVDLVRQAMEDAYKRLLSRAMETEVRLRSKEIADSEAITVFTDNLRQLLLSPPLGAKRIMGLDPGFRTGCKLVCLDQQGKLLHHETIYPHSGNNQFLKAQQTVQRLVKQYDIEAVAIGNGTAGRETEAFIKSIDFKNNIITIIVNESGASIYSASEIAREEFPDLDLTVRGAVSIARRLMDPLAELVKIDPKSIGVGQYQHDVDQTALKQALDDVVMSCVNSVGVDVNRASAQLLTYVSGLGPQLAKNIVLYRDQNGPFEGRQQFHQVPRLGPKAFEQAAGFLRIQHSPNPLDASAVHPESYPIVDKMAQDLNSSVQEMMSSIQLRQKIKLENYISDQVGLPTLNDIMDELAKPGRDPRDQFEAFSFASGVGKMEDLQIGMKLPGIITNITKFGAFVDVGVHQDGLVHISELADHFVKDPSDVVHVHQKVSVHVIDVDLGRKRIALSMKADPYATKPAQKAPTQKAGVQKRVVKPGNKRPSKGPEPFNNPFADMLRNRR